MLTITIMLEVVPASLNVLPPPDPFPPKALPIYAANKKKLSSY